MGIFDNIITPEHKALYKDAISAVIAKDGLGSLCKLTYLNNINSHNQCNNCSIDPIYKVSTGKYNGSGPVPFPEGAICPICKGQGYKTGNSEELVYMAVLSSEKAWIKIGIDPVKIPNGSVQTICDSSLYQKIKNSFSLTLSDDNGINENLKYERAGDISSFGFGNDSFAVAIWKRMI